MIVNGVQGVQMQKVYSNVTPGMLLHTCFSLDSMPRGRTDMVDGKEGMQVAAMLVNQGKSFQPHRHMSRLRDFQITQETWIVISGRIRVSYYDLDGTYLSDAILIAGDVSITFRGGHGYDVVEDSEVVEVKLGPYAAVADKEYLG